MSTKQQLIILGCVGAIIALALCAWFFFLRPSSSLQSVPPTNTFGTATNDSTDVTTTSSSNNTNAIQQINSTSATTQQKIFEIAQGPVVGATLIQTFEPTTTLARYIDQTDGHVYDLPLDVPGAVPRVVSNVTIPGGVRAIWVNQGNAVIMQYLDGNTVKTVYLGFPSASTTANTLPTTIKFLPDNIIDIAASPDGTSLAYLLPSTIGADGYIANSDGTAAKKLFSLPLSQMLISWPSPSTLLVQTKSAAGVPGIAFSIDAKSGAAVSLLYASDLTTTADKTFSTVIYQTDAAGSPMSYMHTVKTGLNTPLAFNPFPEQCMWSSIATSTMYCASPLQAVSSSYLDQWHQGTSGTANAIFSFNVADSNSTIVTVPGGKDGGVSSDISELSLSPDEHYLDFVTKGDRSLWGVRLTQ